jgi:hypothetical protein
LKTRRLAVFLDFCSTARGHEVLLRAARGWARENGCTIDMYKREIHNKKIKQRETTTLTYVRSFALPSPCNSSIPPANATNRDPLTMKLLPTEGAAPLKKPNTPRV